MKYLKTFEELNGAIKMYWKIKNISKNYFITALYKLYGSDSETLLNDNILKILGQNEKYPYIYVTSIEYSGLGMWDINTDIETIKRRKFKFKKEIKLSKKEIEESEIEQDTNKYNL